jgi:hypothetical protein
VPGSGNTQRMLARQAILWPHHFTLQAAVAADSRASASHVLTDRPGRAGSPLFVVLGDAAGTLYFFTPGGHLLYEYDTGRGRVVEERADAPRVCRKSLPAEHQPACALSPPPAPPGFNSSVTALTSDLQRHNETQLLLGLQDGTLALLLVGHEHARCVAGLAGPSSVLRPGGVC